MLAAQIQTLAPSLLGMAPSSKSRTEWRFRNRGSLSVVTEGQDQGQFFDHEAGVGGDALDLVCHLRACDRREAWRWSMDWLGAAPPPLPAPVPTVRAQRLQDQELPRAIWAEATALPGTPAEIYLHTRGLTLQSRAPLRFHPACPRSGERYPAMIALMTDPKTNQPVGIHRTFIEADGSGKAAIEPAKMMLGNAGIVRLVPDEEVSLGFGIAEGIENALAVMQMTGWRPVWAAGSAGGIAKFPVLRGIEAITIFADADDKGAGLRAAHECAGRWYAEGREAIIQQPPTGTDWLDALHACRRAA